MNRRTKIGLAVGALAAVTVGAAVVVTSNGDNESTAPPALTAAARGSAVATVTATGNILTGGDLGVDFPSGGRLTEVSVHPGDHVTKGQVLARVDDRVAKDGVSAAEVGLAAMTAKGGTQAELAAAQANLTAAHAVLDAASLIAPAEGTVTAVANKVGERVGSSVPTGGEAAVTGAPTGGATTPGAGPLAAPASFISLSPVADLRVRAGFSEVDAVNLAVDEPATVTFDALPGVKIAGKVASVSPSGIVVNNVVTFLATVLLPSPPPRARPGMTSQIQVQVGERHDVLLVPNSAIATQAGTSDVYVMQGDQLVARPVTLGFKGDDASEIIGGLTDGEKFATSGAPISSDPGDPNDAKDQKPTPKLGGP